MKITDNTSYQDLVSILESVEGKMVRAEIERWHGINDIEEAKSFVEGLLVVIEVMDTMNNQLDLLKEQQSMFDGVLESCNCIVGWEITGLTVEVPEKNGVRNTKDAIVANLTTPVQYSYRDAKAIAESVKNGSGHSPKVYDKRDWYKLQITRMENTIAEWTVNRNKNR
jgi:hypothetical protein